MVIDKEKIRKMIAGVKCCAVGACEKCPYAPAGESCGDEHAADMLELLEGVLHDNENQEQGARIEDQGACDESER